MISKKTLFICIVLELFFDWKRLENVKNAHSNAYKRVIFSSKSKKAHLYELLKRLNTVFWWKTRYRKLKAHISKHKNEFFSIFEWLGSLFLQS